MNPSYSSDFFTNFKKAHIGLQSKNIANNSSKAQFIMDYGKETILKHLLEFLSKYAFKVWVKVMQKLWDFLTKTYDFSFF